MKMRVRQKGCSRRELTWFNIVGTLDEVLEEIRGFYETLAADYTLVRATS